MSKRPEWYKPKTEVGASGTDQKSDEMQLVNVSWGQYAEEFAEDKDINYHDEINEIILNKMNVTEEAMLKIAPAEKSLNTTILDDPEIWVVDTGATCHGIGHSAGMTNVHANGSKTKMGNGVKVASKSIGEIPFQASNSGTKGTIGGVHLMLGAPFNLISGTKLLLKGYMVTGDKGKLTYSKNNQKLMFDIKVNTPEGMLLAARLKRMATEVG